MVVAVDGCDQAYLAHRGNMRVILCQKADTQIILEKRVNPIQRASRPSASDCKIAVAEDDSVVFLTKTLDGKSDVAGMQRLTGSNENMPV